MNLGRFHAAVWALKLEIEEYEIKALFAKLESSLSQSVSQPTPETATAFKTTFDELTTVLEHVPSNDATPSRRRIFRELDAENKIGCGLLARI
ncbi:MAG: hypothetical protein V3V95_01970, partial [Thermodesulfobacteriota bacterium]